MLKKRSSILYGILLVMFIALLLAGFLVPQETLDYFEIYFLLFVMPLMGWMWLQAYSDASRGN